MYSFLMPWRTIIQKKKRKRTEPPKYANLYKITTTFWPLSTQQQRGGGDEEQQHRCRKFRTHAHFHGGVWPF